LGIEPHGSPVGAVRGFALLTRAEEFRLLRSLRASHATRPGRVLGMVFEKASTRTRANNPGGSAVTLRLASRSQRNSQIRSKSLVTMRELGPNVV